MDIFACSLCARLGLQLPRVDSEKIKNCFFVCYSPIGLVNASPFGDQSQPIGGPSLPGSHENWVMKYL